LREKLVIEVDGGYHEEAAQKGDDQRRTLDLARMGYTVIRFRNKDVANNTDHVIEQIKKQLFNE
jgi:very-short-patch-repair endonuclease